MTTNAKQSALVSQQQACGPHRCMPLGVYLLLAALTACATGGPALSAAEPDPAAATIVSDAACKAAIERALSLLEAAAAGSAQQRKCFTCHSQAHPVIVLTAARQQGFRIDQDNLDRQIRHTAKHLDRGRNDYVEGRGQGGKSDTAGYALWTLQAGGFDSAETTDPVVSWLLKQQQEAGQWKRSSERPPSEASHFTTTYLALRGIGHFRGEMQQAELDERVQRAGKWLLETTPTDTEDRVFRLLGLELAGAPEQSLRLAAEELLATQHGDGGWPQRASMQSDAYATGTALVALHHSQQLRAEETAFQNGIGYLIDSQLEDGSWHVVSRSDPFQAYYETGFPHGKDQFISTSATAWATLALLLAHHPDPKPTAPTTTATNPPQQ